MKRILLVSILALAIAANKGKGGGKNNNNKNNKEKPEKGWKTARDHWNPNQVKHDTQAGIAMIGDTKVMLPGAIRREAAKEAAKRNAEKMESCKKQVCRSECSNDKSVGCKYCVLKTCLKRPPKAGTCAKNKCMDKFDNKRNWIYCMNQNCADKNGAGPLFARGFTGTDRDEGKDQKGNNNGKKGRWNGKGKGAKRNKAMKASQG